MQTPNRGKRNETRTLGVSSYEDYLRTYYPNRYKQEHPEDSGELDTSREGKRLADDTLQRIRAILTE